MATSPTRYCSHPGCPERTTGSRCDKHRRSRNRQRDGHRASSAARGYDVAWRKVRGLWLAMNPLCADCLQNGRAVPAKEVHHVAKVCKEPEKRLDLDNLMSLCRPCHAIRSARGE